MFTPHSPNPDRKVMLCERCVKFKFNLTLLQPFTNIVMLCASWDASIQPQISIKLASQ
jgi:hypothetical protein